MALNQYKGLRSTLTSKEDLKAQPFFPKVCLFFEEDFCFGLSLLYFQKLYFSR